MSGEGNDSPDAWPSIDIVTGAVARQNPSVLFQPAPDLIGSGLQFRVSLVLYMCVFLGDVNPFSANK